MPASRKKTSMQRRKNTQEAIKGEIGHQIDQGKLSLVRNSTKNLDVRRKYGGKILQRDTSQIKQKQY